MEFEIYRIQKGDTLESISKKLNISLFELRNFHNKYCDLKDLIGNKLPAHIKEIKYIPVKDWVQQGLEELKQKNSFSLDFNPSLEKITYHATVTFYEGAKENSVSYLFHIEWIKRNLVRITKEEFLINHQEPDLMADRIALKISQTLFPLELSLDNCGKIFSIQNHREIKNRWPSVKNKIRDYFASEVLEKYLQRNEVIIEDETALLQQIKKDAFLYSFFNGIYQTYQLGENTLTNKYFPLIANLLPIEYAVQTQIEDLAEKEKIKLSFAGTVSDTRSYADVEQGNYYPSIEQEENPQPLQGNYNSWYLLDYDHYRIDSFLLECNLAMKEEQKIEVRAFRIQEPPTLIKEEGIIEIVKPADNKRNRSFLAD
ncbi:LysM domain-containing protein [Apibacter muscae]|uniref:LysM domain-containing protein n=1 Tax=Apibacter muscae TaxID=2509004 RepID=A0A563D7N5_9FLAO|nr:LysM domain-containing protein [Apibacter muscae]TWP26107.1 LysM domain-containing protein [Apibacter muscae]